MRQPTAVDHTRYYLIGAGLALLSAGLYAGGILLFNEAFPLFVILPMGLVLLGGPGPMLMAGWGGLVLAVALAHFGGVAFASADIARHITAFVAIPAFATVGEMLRRNRLAAALRQQQVDDANADLQLMVGRLEQSLAEQKERHTQLEVITSSVPGVIFQYFTKANGEHGFVYVSANAGHTFGLPQALLMQDPSAAWRCIHRDDRRAVQEQVQRAMKAGAPWVQEFRIICPKEPRQTCWISVHAVPRLDRQRAACIWTGIVTVDDERRELQDRLWQAQRLDGIGVLAGGIAHDFNNVLTAVIAEVDLLSYDFADHPTAQESLTHIRTAAESGATLSRHLLGFAGRAVNAPRIVPVDQAVARVAPLLRRLVREKIQLEIDVPPGLGNIRIDQGLFDQVLMNLATNARDAMDGSGLLRIRALRHDGKRPAYFDTLPAGALIEIVVSDSGPGMPEHVRPHAFEPFFTTKSVGRGSGLGLATSHGIIHQAEGAMYIDPSDGPGCTIRIALPVNSDAAAVVVDQLDAGPSGVETLLVVDDEHQVRRVTTETLRRRGYRVLEAASASDALRLARRTEFPIDLMITDVVMPDMDGVQLAAIMEREQLTRGVLFVSGYAAESMAKYGVDSSDIDLISKPYRVATLAARVRSRLDAMLVP